MKLMVLFCLALLLSLSVQSEVSSSPEPEEESLSEPREAQCDKYGSVCTKEFDPVCGDDGETHSNECVLCQENKNKTQKVKVVYKGECRAEPASQSTED